MIVVIIVIMFIMESERDDEKRYQFIIFCPCIDRKDKMQVRKKNDRANKRNTRNNRMKQMVLKHTIHTR